MTYGLNSDAKNFKIFSGFLPPDFYSIKSKENDCPLNLECYKDYSEGLQVAKTRNKPILLDFTGWACVNCRKIEENVWSKPEIYEILSNDVVIVSLYVDDRKKMLENEQFNFKFNDGTLKKIKTIGDKWSTFQSHNFSSASQPFYVLLSNNEEILNPPIQYTNAENYFNWLKNGLKL
jgi:thiol:disulfide interchange protein DsbD